MASPSSLAKKYPYPSNLNIGNFVSIKLSQTNCLLWRTQMLGLIESQDMMCFVNGTLAAPSETITTPDSSSPSSKKEIENPEFHLWRCSDRLLRGWLTGTMNEEALSLVVGLNTAHEVWEALNNSFA
ncbi:hypothetical protein AAC387_Pa02g1716 [Persea americana]